MFQPDTAKLFYLMGPSGSGKDTLLNHLKHHHYSNNQPIVAHRYITRPMRENDENHIELSERDFKRRKKLGLFLFDWFSHGNYYAVGKEVKKWRTSGFNVIVNGSREYLETAQKEYPLVVPIWLSVSKAVLRQRLTERGRESSEQIDARLQRTIDLKLLKPKHCLHLTNDQEIETTIQQLLTLIDHSDDYNVKSTV